ncbi:MAG: universal stress protein [Gemmataceae bacterium]|nr:universal stress protein [Gemmataceae bacterium]
MLPIHTILFPTDFSESAQQVFPLTCALARDCGARVVVLHVVPPPLGHDRVLAQQNPEEYYEGPRTALHQVKAPDANVRVEYRLADGHAPQEILKAADNVEAGLIVIGTHGRSGLGRLLLGSVAEKVLRGAMCPVLTVKTGPSALSIRTILFPTDLSEASESALGVAFSLARDYHARLIVLHIASFGQGLPYSALEAMLKESSAYRRELEDQLRQCQKPECHAEFRVEEGDPAEQIARVAREARCDLIVMGSHGRTGLARLLMGSVAEKTLRSASCPVLLVKHSVRGVETSHKPQPQSV